MKKFLDDIIKYWQLIFLFLVVIFTTGGMWYRIDVIEAVTIENKEAIKPCNDNIIRFSEQIRAIEKNQILMLNILEKKL